MLTIKTFQKLISTQPERRDPYLNSLSALTKLTPAQIHAFTSDMIWMDWFGPQQSKDSGR